MLLKAGMNKFSTFFFFLRKFFIFSISKWNYPFSTGVNNQKEKNPELGDLEAFFISIDTARDTFEQINDYCKDFHPQLKGLSVSFSFV